ncbi:MAG: LacI family DNA-binding transcriptional regulator [Chloroflexi bacterium]|nr:LacI family DNA-binding transcriptional regulator [Chloroflexota bacterium]
MTTFRQIAQAAGVSISTVSLVINDKAGVSQKKREAVHDAIQRLEAGLGPASKNRTKRSNTGKIERSKRSKEEALSFMVLHPPVPSSYYVFSQVLQGIQAGAEANLIQLRLVANEPDMGDDHLAYQYLRDPLLRPDGLIMFGAKEKEPLLASALSYKIPCVVLGREVGKYTVSGLGRNEAQCGYMATNYLLELGHRAIAFVGGESGFDYVRNRLKGYQNAMKVAGIKVAQAWVRHGDAIPATAAVLEQSPEVTAIMFVNDQFAADGLLVIRQRGLDVPNDLSVLSFDDTNIAREATPPLTSVAYRLFEEGQWAVKMLLDQIRFPALDMVHTYFKAELIKRKSCSPPSR